MMPHSTSAVIEQNPPNFPIVIQFDLPSMDQSIPSPTSLPDPLANAPPSICTNFTLINLYRDHYYHDQQQLDQWLKIAHQLHD